MRGLILGLALGAASLAGTANAATLSFSGSGSSSFDLSRFDTSLGTLTSALFSVRGAATATNEFTASLVARADANAVLSVLFAGLGFGDEDSATDECFTNDFDIFCTATATATATLDDSASILDLDRVSGQGFETVDVLLANVGEVAATVTYTYTPAPAPVPLPAAGAMLLAGLGGLALMRRKPAA
jgi:hypothetical protein